MNNDFIDIMHDRLLQHEMIEPSGLWQEIENSLDSRGTHKKKGLVASRSAIYKAVAGVAAAALVAMVMWTTHNSPSKIEGAGGSMIPMRSPSTPKERVGGSMKTPSQEQLTNNQAPENTPFVGAKHASSSHSKIGQWCKPNAEVCESSPSKIEGAGGSMIPMRSPLTPEERAGGSMTSPAQEQLATTITTDTVTYKEDVTQPQAPAKENLALNDADTATNQVDTTLTIPYEPAHQLPQLWAFTESTRKNDRKPEFALSYNGHLASAGSEDFRDLNDASPGWAPENSSPDPENPDNYETVHVDENEQIVPVRVGLEVWYPIGEKWRVGSGIIYTRLSRKKTTTYTTGDKSSWMQEHETANYLGIPLEASRILWNRKRWSFYASAGAMIEFNLKSKLRKETDFEIFTNREFRDRRPQFSALGKLGLQYNVADRIGIYFEPGASYYFNNGTDNNIYMAHPLRFDINLGIKINLNK